MPTPMWLLILSTPFGMILGFTSFFLLIFLYMLILKTPCMTFLKASFGKKMILANPDEDKRLIFRIAKKESDMAFVKKRGYYIIDPKHVYLEGISKIPIAITYGSFSESIDPEDAEIAEKLNDLGVKNYVELMGQYFKQVPADEMLKKKMITKEDYDAAPNKIYTVRREKVPDLKIFGKSISFDNITQYFSKNTRADLIEAKIQHRIAEIKMEKLAGDKSMLKWAVFIIIIMIGGALAYVMLTMGRPEPAQAAAQNPQAVGGIVGNAVNTITGTGIS